MSTPTCIFLWLKPTFFSISFLQSTQSEYQELPYHVKKLLPFCTKTWKRLNMRSQKKRYPTDCHNITFTYSDRYLSEEKYEDENVYEAFMCLSIHQINKCFELCKITFANDIFVHPTRNDIVRTINERMSTIPCNNDRQQSIIFDCGIIDLQ